MINANAILLCHGWEKSKAVRFEVSVAKKMGIPYIRYRRGKLELVKWPKRGK